MTMKYDSLSSIHFANACTFPYKIQFQCPFTVKRRCGSALPPVVALTASSDISTSSAFSAQLCSKGLELRRLALLKDVKIASHSSPPSLSFKLPDSHRSASFNTSPSLFCIKAHSTFRKYFRWKYPLRDRRRVTSRAFVSLILS